MIHEFLENILLAFLLLKNEEKQINVPYTKNSKDLLSSYLSSDSLINLDSISE